MFVSAQSLNEVMEKISSANHSQAIENHCDVIAERLSQVQSSSIRKSTEDCQRLKGERDEAVKQVRQLSDIALIQLS